MKKSDFKHALDQGHLWMFSGVAMLEIVSVTDRNANLFNHERNRMFFNQQKETPAIRTNLPVQLLRLSFALCLTISLSGLAAWSQDTSTVTINATSVSNTVGPEAYGVDTAVYDGYLTSSGVGASLKQAGINAIRYPGGSYADIFNFISGTDNSLNGGAYYVASDNFANFMSSTVAPNGGKPIITVNYGSNIGGTGPALPSEAASWVEYANKTNNYGIVYWEIGNEVYGNGYYSTTLDWEEDLHDTNTNAASRVGNAALSPTAYGTNAAAFIKAMKAVDPSIKCGVFVNTASYYTNWDKDVLSAVSSALNGSGYTLDFVDVHYYPGGNDAQNLAAQAGIPAEAAQIRSDISNYYKLSNASSMQILITESGPPAVGGIEPFLFANDDYLTWIENGASNVEYEELHNGFLANSGTIQPYGPWYGAQMASTIARPGDSMVEATSSNALLRAHGVNRTDGNLGVVLINDDPTNSAKVTVNVSNATLATSGTLYEFGNANFSSGHDYANSGIAKSTVSGLGSSFTITVPAYTTSSLVIAKTSGGGTPTPITPYVYVNGVWVEENTATVSSASAVIDLGPQPATGGSWSWTGPNGFTSTARQINNIALPSASNVYVATYTNTSGAKSTETFTIKVN